MLVARLPHTLTRSDDSRVEGSRRIGLCSRCDREDPEAQGLLAFFAVHEAVTDATMPSVAELLAEWTDRVAARQTRSQLDTQRGDRGLLQRREPLSPSRYPLD
jgi:hypothetical protein